MPVYTYRCKNCGHEFQTRQRMTDDPLKECPVCEGEVRRVISSVGVVYKGKGFYVTDNRSSNLNGKGKSASKSEEKEGSKETVSSADSESKTESKADSKSESKTKKSESDS